MYEATMKRLVMNRGHSHLVYGKMMNAGDEFEVPDREAQTWMKLGRASLKSEVAGDATVPEGASPQRVEGSQSKRKRYNRMDLRAEEE